MPIKKGKTIEELFLEIEKVKKDLVSKIKTVQNETDDTIAAILKKIDEEEYKKAKKALKNN